MSAMVKGHGLPPDNPGHRGGCVMDWAVWRLTEGQVWADQHPCFNRAVTFAAQRINDLLDAEGRDRLERDFGGAGGRIDRARACRDEATEARVNRRLALWAARRVEHLAGPASKACNDVTERFLAGEAGRDELRKARAAAADAAAAYAAAAAAAAAYAADAAAAYAAAYAAADAYAAAYAADAADPLQFLSDLIDAHEKIAADEGALGDLWTWEDYCQAGGS